MVALLLLAAPVATALLLAASARVPSLVSTLLLAYLALVAEVALVTSALSPFRAVTRPGLAGAEAAFLAVAVGVWWLRRRPLPPLGDAGLAVRRVAADPITLAFGVVAAAALAYELVLVLSVPPNNWDSLTYHLARAAAWAQHGGVHWIPNAPTDRLNEFQPLAEQEILFLFVATGKGALFGLPQYLAELAILVAVYGASRRLGFDTRAAACSAFLLTTFSLVALEAPTAQNDLVAASFVIVAGCLILGGAPVELLAAGAALGLGLGAKLTTLLVWPVLALLVVACGRRAFGLVAAGAAAAFVALASWGYALNLAHTGHALGNGGGRLEVTVSPSFTGSLTTAVHVLYRTFDATVLSNGLIEFLAVAGIVLGALTGALVFRREGLRSALVAGSGVAIPFLAPAIVLGAAAATEYVTQRVNLPLHPPGPKEGFNRTANEDYSAFGPVGAVVLLGVPVLTALAFWRARRIDLRWLALALALPTFLALLSLQAKYNLFLTRFLLVPAVLTAPLFALYFRRRATTAALAGMAALCVALTLAHTVTRPLDGGYARPWQLSQANALRQTSVPLGGALEVYEQEVPSRACVGAVVGPDEPSYVLWGPKLDRKVLYLPVGEAVAAAYRLGLFYVVISSGENRWAADRFEEAGWAVQPLDEYWLLAVAPGASHGDCAAA